MAVEHDDVTRPAHYVRASLEPIQLIDALGLGFYEGNVVKYVCRHEHKNGLEDLRKAAWYLDRLVAKETGEQRYPTIPTEGARFVDPALVDALVQFLSIFDAWSKGQA